MHIRYGFGLCLLSLLIAGLSATQAQDVGELKDNSFLLEEAYNQEPGEVQHILMPELDANSFGGFEQRHQVELTQEWPLGGKRLQLSYTIPVGSSDGSEWNVDHMVLRARYQVADEPAQPFAFAPALSLIWQKNPLERSFLTRSTVGVGLLLPVSHTLSSRWALHANAGTTWLPDPYATDWNDFSTRPLFAELRQDRWIHRLGTGLVYAALPKFHLLFETIGEFEQFQGNDFVDSDMEPALILNPGARTGFDIGGGTQLVLGVGFPIELTEDNPPDYRVLLYTSLEHSLGR